MTVKVNCYRLSCSFQLVKNILLAYPTFLTLLRANLNKFKKKNIVSADLGMANASGVGRGGGWGWGLGRA